MPYIFTHHKGFSSQLPAVLDGMKKILTCLEQTTLPL